MNKMPTENLIKMAEFVLKNNLCEFNNKVELNSIELNTLFIVKMQ